MTWGATDLTVTFGGQVVLDRVSITVEPGIVHAVVGGDGAGKSTLLRVLAGAGMRIGGAVKLPPSERIGYVPSNGGIFGDLTVAENMAFTAAAYRLSSWRSRADELLQRADIDQFGDRLAGRLSGGQKRKLAGSMALLPEPALLVLDEVTTGVDPVSRMELWRMIAGAAAADTAVVVATTYLDEAERAGWVELLHRGTTLASGTPESITASIPGHVRDLDHPLDRATAWRRGSRWRQWSPAVGPSDAPTLEDAAIVFELLASQRTMEVPS